MKYLVCNFKENKTLGEILKYLEDYRNIPKTQLQIIVCPSYPYLLLFNKSNCLLGSQDVSIYQKGSHTGEVSALQLASVNCKYAIIGHSERRTLYNENEIVLSKKINNCFSAGLKVIYCIGETLEERERLKTMSVLEKQIGRVLNNFKREELKNIIIAYEPIWAIGTGKKASNIIIYEVISFIKKLLKEYYELDIPVLYGGSVNKDNIEELEQLLIIDGYLLGKSSLDIEELSEIINKINKI